MPWPRDIASGGRWVRIGERRLYTVIGAPRFCNAGLRLQRAHIPVANSEIETLRNVADTGPWGHNGIFRSLTEVMAHHLNPVPTLYAAQQKSPEQAAYAGRLLGFRSPILAAVAHRLP